MNESYTQDVREQFNALIYDETAQAMLNTVKNFSAEEGCHEWAKELRIVAEDNRYNARFALMRLLWAHASGQSVSSDLTLPAKKWTVRAGGHKYDLCPFSAENINELDRVYLNRCKRYAVALAAERDGYDEEVAEKVIARALGTGHTARLSREEIFRLAQVLGFTIPELQWFLLRVLDVDEGVAFTSAHDLIHIYGLYMGGGLPKVKELTDWYETATVGIEKEALDTRPDRWTQTAESKLESIVAFAKSNPDTGDTAFQKYLLENASHLDAPSRTATSLYRQLAQYAYKIIEGQIELPDDEHDMEDALYRVAEDIFRRSALQDPGSQEISFDRCNDVALTLLSKNRLMGGLTRADSSEIWSIVTTTRGGEATANGLLNENRHRIRDLLYGTEAVTKADILMLVFFTYSLCWELDPQPGPAKIYDRFYDYINTSEFYLSEAGLPEMYMPHLLEQTLLQSIIRSVRLELSFIGPLEENAEIEPISGPLQVYVYTVNALRRSREAPGDEPDDDPDDDPDLD